MQDLLGFQKNEITEFFIYNNLAKKAKDQKNRKVLSHIAGDEKKHYSALKEITGKEVKPNKARVWWYLILASIFGLAFSLKFMERGEKLSQKNYKLISRKNFHSMIKDEERHEMELLEMLSDSRVEYASSIVLGLNDALVELTGALAGLTFALRNGKIIALTGTITGFAASLSMAASAYLSSKEDLDKKNKIQKGHKTPLRGAFYTGITYLVTVIILIIPFLLLSNVYYALTTTLITAILIIAFYTFYISTAKNLKFWRRFLEMALISLTVAAISFGVGLLMRYYLGIEV